MPLAHKRLLCLPCLKRLGLPYGGASSFGTCRECGLTGVSRWEVKTALRDDTPAVSVPLATLERIYRAATIIDENGHGNEMIDEILFAVEALLPDSVRARIDAEIEANPESGLEGG